MVVLEIIGVLFGLLLIPLLVWAVLSVTHGERLREVYSRHLATARQERIFLSSMSFFIAFAITRGVTYSIHEQVGPFRNVVVGGMHVHHLVWGILLLLLVGYLWLAQVGIGTGETSGTLSRATAILFGLGAALTLDEFALWLHLEDVYWEREGRASIDVSLLFGSLLTVGLWGGAFLHGVLREAVHVLRR
jgi:hypothetical protein